MDTSKYEIKDEDDMNVALDVLTLYYGNLWESALDRLGHQCDGHLLTIQHEGQRLKIYRKIDQKGQKGSHPD